MNHPSVDLQGSVISGEVLDLLVRGEMAGQKPADFGLPADVTLERAIGEAWTTARAKWKQFQDRRARITTNGFAETRKHWIKPLFQELGYELEGSEPELLEGHEKPYPISLRAEGLNGFPVHAVGTGYTLDERYSLGGRVQSAQALLQEYLNHSEHVYGIVTNGLQVRLLRDSTRLGRLAYVEFDLERILEQEIYPDFQAFYRLLHASRLPRKPEATEEALIERYHQHGIDSGSRIREKLRLEVKKAMETMANGLLGQNPAFAEVVLQKQVKAEDFYKALLRTIYRMLFLIVIEERDLVHAEPADERDPVIRQRDIYRRYYSFARLRKLALRASYVDARRTDLWQSLLSTFRLFEREGHGVALGIAPLGGDLFGRPLETNGHDFHSLGLSNGALLDILSGLTLTRNEQGALVAVNYNDLDVEELGSIYEGLLELHPVIDTSTGTPLFSFTPGSVRKLTGSYYTRHDLVAQLIRTALEPVLEERLKGKRGKEEQEAALLDITVVDPACGSGHFLLAAARKLSERLAQIRSGNENPGKRDLITARRDVIGQCIYGVDKNPAAVELCRLALWLEAHTVGKPLTFLEHRIRPGDSLVGVDDLKVLEGGIPDGAYKPVTGDHKPTASAAKRNNKTYRDGRQLDLFRERMHVEQDLGRFAEGYRAIQALRSDDLDSLAEKEARYKKYRSDRGWWKDKVACDLFVYAFYQPYREGMDAAQVVDTQMMDRLMTSGGSAQAQVEARAVELSERERFFHWPLEFPEVWQRGGFDLVLGNPPWERVKLEEKEFFGTRSEEVAQAKKAADRKRVIQRLKESDPSLFAEYQAALHAAEAASKYVRESGIYPLCGRGDVNLYSVFAEGSRNHLALEGRMGIVLPTGIATDDTTKFFFQDLIAKGSLVSLYDFENKLLIFPDVAPPQKFCLFTSKGVQEIPLNNRQPAEFAFFALRVEDLLDSDRRISLTSDDITLLNPNTRTCPIFRSRRDAELTKSIFKRIPVLVLENDPEGNPWGLKFSRMFDMSNDSGLFRTKEELDGTGWRLMGNVFEKEGKRYLPLHEAKMFHQFDHRYNSYEGVPIESRFNVKAFARSMDGKKHSPVSYALPRYWVKEDAVDASWPGERQWVPVYRDVTNVNTNRRTAMFAILNKRALVSPATDLRSVEPSVAACAFAQFNSFGFDYVARQFVGGSHLTLFTLKQLPVLLPGTYDEIVLGMDLPLRSWILKRVLEITYTAWDLKTFAEDCGIDTPPFRWDDERRFQIRAELDAAFFHLYLGTEEEWKANGPAELLAAFPTPRHAVEHIMGTFPIVQKQEEEKYGHYRSKETILRIYDEMAEAANTGRAWQSPLDPPPGDVRCCHPAETKHEYR